MTFSQMKATCNMYLAWLLCQGFTGPLFLKKTDCIRKKRELNRSPCSSLHQIHMALNHSQRRLKVLYTIKGCYGQEKNSPVGRNLGQTPRCRAAICFDQLGWKEEKEKNKHARRAIWEDRSEWVESNWLEGDHSFDKNVNWKATEKTGV